MKKNKTSKRLSLSCVARFVFFVRKKNSTLLLENRTRAYLVHLLFQSAQLLLAAAQLFADPASPYHRSLLRCVQSGDLESLCFEGGLLQTGTYIKSGAWGARHARSRQDNRMYQDIKAARGQTVAQKDAWLRPNPFGDIRTLQIWR